MPREIPDFVSGRSRSRYPDAKLNSPEPVVVVLRSEALEAFGARDERELREHLRGLRARGLLLTRGPGSLQHQVRLGTRVLANGQRRAQKARMYVVRAERIEDVPVIRGPGAGLVW